MRERIPTVDVLKPPAGATSPVKLAPVYELGTESRKLDDVPGTAKGTRLDP